MTVPNLMSKVFSYQDLRRKAGGGGHIVAIVSIRKAAIHTLWFFVIEK